ncbi:hypothetical protein WA026_023708 [Henosepilachna vigintioctopunctata]|uniref:Peptidase aspartic putative domain-containing protein n=1 Tax=Henosepilachna vigintioctopunctata TaxID=420089 RepID=A0AAW1UQ25_9CUCU
MKFEWSNESFSGLIPKNNLLFAQMLLSTLKLKIQDIFGKFHLVTAILDSGSQLSFISETLAKKLILKPLMRPFLYTVWTTCALLLIRQFNVKCILYIMQISSFQLKPA